MWLFFMHTPHVLMLMHMPFTLSLHVSLARYFSRALNESGLEYKPWNYDYKDCYRGLAVQAKQGSAVLFYSMLPNAELDERALHGGCPPAKGSKPKWGANQWVYNKPYAGINGPCQRRSIDAAKQRTDL